MESRKPVRNLSETLHSLLGLKAHITSAWVKSVCSIVKNVSSEEVLLPSELKAQNFQTRDSCGNKDDESVSIQVLKVKDELSALNTYVKELNIKRRQVLNDFLDLKGNIRVFCRIRPIGIEEHIRHLKSVVASDSRNVILKVAETKSKSYNFDKVFHPDSSQDEVFSEIEPVIKSVLDGYNACIFAYGQTGTGKTYTMEGTLDSPGIVPRAIEALFKQALESNHAFLISFSMLEIYLGNLRDLLVPQPTKPTDPIPPCLLIHTDPKGGIEIENLVAVKVSDFHQALKLYKLGCRYRSTASTNSNTTSSRSHCMIRMSLTCFDAPERRRETNKIWFVDLGGSERVLKTKASGRRLDEGKAINLSLSAVGDVINALQRKKRHIPYRNSKLTQVLKDSLGQDSKTLMLVHVSPKEDDLCETICSLNFATRAKSIHLGHDEPAEEREQNEAAMKNLLQTMENIEEERQRIVKDIKKLNEMLENLTGRAPSSEENMESSYLPVDERSYEAEIKKKKPGDVKAAPLSGLPSFMRPTVSSRKRSGKDIQNPGLVFERRRPSSRHAESVTFPVKKNSEYNSDRSISKSTFLAGLTTKSNADCVTEYSQDISECDVKVVVSENKKNPYKSSDQQRAYHVSKLEIYSKGKTNKGNSTNFSRVDNWLRLQKNEPNNGTYTHRKKQVIAAPTLEKTHKLKERNINEMLPDVKVCADKFVPQKTISTKYIEGQANVEAILEEIDDSETREVIDKPMAILKDLFAVEIKSDSSCERDEQSMTQMQNSEDEGSLMDGSECCSLYPPTAGYDGYCQCMDGNEEYTVQTEFSDRHMDQSMCQLSLLEVDYSADSERDSSASLSILERKPHCDQIPTVMGTESDEQENMNASFQLSPKEKTISLLKPKSQRALFMNNASGQDFKSLFVQPKGKLEGKGKFYVVKEKVQTLCFSALLGLGFLGVGYDNHFFHGVMS